MWSRQALVCARPSAPLNRALLYANSSSHPGYVSSTTHKSHRRSAKWLKHQGQDQLHQSIASRTRTDPNRRGSRQTRPTESNYPWRKIRPEWECRTTKVDLEPNWHLTRRRSTDQSIGSSWCLMLIRRLGRNRFR